MRKPARSHDRPTPDTMDLLITMNLKAVNRDSATQHLYRKAYLSACLGHPRHAPDISAKWFWALHDRLPETHRPVFLFDWRVIIDQLRATEPRAAARLAGHTLKTAAAGSLEETALRVSFHDALGKIRPDRHSAIRLARSIFTEAANDNRQKQLLCIARHHLKTRLFDI